MFKSSATHKSRTLGELEEELASYKTNMQVFIQKVEKEVENLIHKYEGHIKNLQKQNQQLRKQLGQQQNTQYDNLFRSSGFQCMSPIKKMGSHFGQESTFVMSGNKFPSIQPMYQTRNKYTDTSNYEDLSQSRFQVEKKKNKQKQENLLQSLESGKSNLDINTSRMYKLLGKQMPEDIDEYQEEEENQQNGQSLRNISDPLNTSLNSVCQSLDTSFYARKSREKKSKLKKEQIKQKNQKQMKEKEAQKKAKDKGLKNLLLIMRNNVNTAGKQPVEVMKSTKLFNPGEQSSPVKSKSKTKVMINPVAIDISKRNRNNTSFNSSPSKSILKQSSHILSKSVIMGASSVSFQR